MSSSHAVPQPVRSSAMRRTCIRGGTTGVQAAGARTDRGGRMDKVIGTLSLVLSIGLFLTALFLPAARIEGVVLSGGQAFVIGYFCSGVFFGPSHLFGALGW